MNEPLVEGGRCFFEYVLRRRVLGLRLFLVALKAASFKSRLVAANNKQGIAIRPQ